MEASVLEEQTGHTAENLKEIPAMICDDLL